jgi:hypothetical protein
MQLNQIIIGEVYTLSQNNQNRVTGGGITQRLITRIDETHFVFLTNSRGGAETNQPPQSIEHWSRCNWINVF